jgi:hypothetical protein
MDGWMEGGREGGRKSVDPRISATNCPLDHPSSPTHCPLDHPSSPSHCPLDRPSSPSHCPLDQPLQCRAPVHCPPFSPLCVSDQRLPLTTHLTSSLPCCAFDQPSASHCATDHPSLMKRNISIYLSIYRYGYGYIDTHSAPDHPSLMKRVRQLAKMLKLSSNVKITAAMDSVYDV